MAAIAGDEDDARRRTPFHSFECNELGTLNVQRQKIDFRYTGVAYHLREYAAGHFEGALCTVLVVELFSFLGHVVNQPASGRMCTRLEVGPVFAAQCGAEDVVIRAVSLAKESGQPSHESSTSPHSRAIISDRNVPSGVRNFAGQAQLGFQTSLCISAMTL